MKKLNKILIFVFVTAILLFGYAMPVNLLVGNWYQQFMPNPSGGTLRDITFVDSLLGFAVSDSCILKTTNGGDNWSIKLQGYYLLERIQFLNKDTGFACAGNNKLFKTTDKGENWATIIPSGIFPIDMSVLNVDTIWLVNNSSIAGGVFRTTNGGVNWTQQFSGGTQNPNKIYMYNARIGFMGNSSATPNIYKTTNSGVNWNINISGENFTDMHFTDSLTGWKCTNSTSQAGKIKKTSDGGNNWIDEFIPPETPPLLFSRMYKFSFVNKDTIWGIGGVYTFNGGQSRGIIYKSTNGGINWSYQIPDTSINIFIYSTIQFVNKNIGWAYSPSLGGVHTKVGGDTLTGIRQINNNIPNIFKLYQNFPNPFNPVTVISYQLRVNSSVILRVFDITGKQVIDLVNQKQSAGTYQVDFSGNDLSSGVYFYRIEARQVGFSTGDFVESKKMVLIK